MKKSILFAIALVTITTISCKDEIMTYEGSNQIYFEYGRFTYLTDSLDVLFAYSPTPVADSILKLPVRISGLVKDFDREIKMGFDPAATTAAEGVDFEFLPSFIHANKVLDTVYVKLKRTEFLNNNSLRLRTRLVPNEHFDTLQTLVYKEHQTANVYNFKFNNIRSKPLGWVKFDSRFTNTLGAYSRVKYETILLACDLDNEFFEFETSAQFTARFGAGNTVIHSFVLRTNRYLEDYKLLHGTPLLDENGVEVKMAAKYI